MSRITGAVRLKGYPATVLTYSADRFGGRVQVGGQVLNGVYSDEGHVIPAQDAQVTDLVELRDALNNIIDTAQEEC